MLNLFSPRGVGILMRYVSAGALLAFDFDGTLAPIGDDPAATAMRPATSALLSALAARARCLVITGRRRNDVRERLGGIDIEVIGNHGLECDPPLPEAAAIAAAVARWREALAPVVAPLDGVWIEDKGLSLAVHYRLAAEPERARAVVEAAALRLPRARVIGGKRVINAVPAGMPHKGTALDRHLRRTGSGSAIYIGDDDTDEDAFALAATCDLLGIRVGASPESRAGWFLTDQVEIDRLLTLLVALHEPLRQAAGS